ncbi:MULTISPECIES: sirohydrochlorin chelatase [Actinoalloteichus]|uniref:sirohydrochlorin chelatase n=1 Tax=Actinoalloteichus TaxID=65496 RepID=UPI001E62B71B|nr:MULTISPECIES: sirohydrochlorin chelatase [Actinoalloteichus]
MSPTLVAVAHGSRDPRSPATIDSLVAGLRRARPSMPVLPAYLELSAPPLDEVLDEVDTESVLVPLLLGHAYHAGVDIPTAVERARRRRPSLRVAVADVLGPDERLESAALRRLAEAGIRPGTPEVGVVLAGAGSSQEQSNSLVRRVAEDWARHHGWAGVVPAFASATGPTAAEAVAELRAAGAERIAVAPWFLAPGLLLNRVIEGVRADEPAAVLAEPMGAAPELVDLVLDRYAAAARSSG